MNYPSHIASPEEAAFYKRNTRRVWVTLALVLAVIAFHRPLIALCTRAIPVSWEVRLGKSMAANSPLPMSDPAILKTLDVISKRLLAACPHQPYSFTFEVLRSDVVNA